ncbi:plasmid mobilization relaxosome protein MobC [Chryseobacterium rhizosphaerae]|uniref:plasmid mobilization relaxosome protein MobC n=1 Tax=Chryseobacterium rhizosphaerae TaxID=395937 RepID=UPI00235A2C45|nr:plasmid mobilization relaxosome protein MobC [Chryseobacterium rhizosphaerae]MDC8102629.1 MobC family plasmid mobilization relaxosome protein [Chryseobacterium rhizosphaerae]
MKKDHSPIRTKNARITLRLDQPIKDKWLLHCRKSNIYLSDFIVNTVEGRMLENDRKEIMSFIEKQGNIFAKIENNINQIARYVNTEKSIPKGLLQEYNSKLQELNSLKTEQNKIIRKIYTKLAK